MASEGAVLHFGDAQREEVGLDGSGAIHAPGAVDQCLDELGFGGACGAVFAQERLGVALVGRVVLSGQDDGLASEAMAQSVEGGALFAGLGAGAGGLLGVRAVDGGAVG